MKHRLASLSSLAAAMLWAGVAMAQTPVTYNFVPTTSGNWATDANWHDNVSGLNFAPNGVLFDERAYINAGGLAGAGTTAFVDATPPPSPGAVFVQHGTAEVRSGGTLNVVRSLNGIWDGSITINGGNVRAALTVQPGGTLNTAGVLTSAPNVGTTGINTITIGGTTAGTATVNVPAAIFRGTTRVFPNAAFTSTGSVTFNTGIYTAEINGSSSPSLNIGQNAILGGTLRASFTGAVPVVGNSWPILTANSVLNNFGAITSTLTLPANQRFMTHVVPIAGNRQRLDLELAEVLVLNVNRDSGVISITHPGALGILLDNYTISSSQNRIVTGNWNSLTDQGLVGGGWNESTANTGGVTELRSSGNGTAAGGANIPLGAIYNSLAGTFAAPVDDISFQYSDSAGRIVDGTVNYTGSKLNDILLQVDPTSGKAKIRNTSATTVNIDGYSISSTASLTPVTWNSLDDQNAAGGDWLEILDATTALLGEVKSSPGAFTTLAPLASYDLGTVFNPAATRDLSFEFLQSGQGVATLGAVVYEAFSTSNADFNASGLVDGVDFLTWQRNNGAGPSAPPSQGDADGNGSVNAADLTIWKQQFGGPGTVQPTSAGVPEPSSLALAACVAIACFTSTSRRASSQRK